MGQRLLIAALLASAFAVGQQPEKPVSGEVVGIERHGTHYEYSVFSGRCRFTGRSKKRIDVQPGTAVKFWTKGKSLFIVDNQGKVHRTQYWLQEFLPQPIPAPRQPAF